MARRASGSRSEGLSRHERRHGEAHAHGEAQARNVAPVQDVEPEAFAAAIASESTLEEQSATKFSITVGWDGFLS